MEQVKKNLDILRDFQNAVSSSDEVLNMKKVLAGQALDHMDKLLDPTPVTGNLTGKCGEDINGDDLGKCKEDTTV